MSKELRVDAVCTKCSHVFVIENFEPDVSYFCKECDKAPTETYLVRIEEGVTQYLGEISTMSKDWARVNAWRAKKAAKKAAKFKRDKSDIANDQMRKIESKPPKEG